MAIIQVEGWGDSLAKNLPQIGSSLAKIFNPDKEKEDAFKKAISDNPALLQQYADMEHENPGTMQRLGLKKFQSLIDNMSMSAEGVQKKVIKGRAENALGTQLTPEQLAKQAANDLGTDTVAAIEAKKREEDFLISSRDTDLKLGNLRIKREGGLLNSELADAEERSTVDAWLKTLPEGADIYQMYKAGKLPTNIRALVFKHQGLKDKLNFDADEEWRRAQAKLEAERNRISANRVGRADIDDYLMRQNIQYGEKAWRDSGMIGDPNTIISLVGDKNKMMNARKNYEMFSKLSKEEKDRVQRENPELFNVMEAVRAMETAGGKGLEQAVDNVRTETRGVINAAAKFKDGLEGYTQESVENLVLLQNTSIDRLISLGYKGKDLKYAHWDAKKGFWDTPALEQAGQPGDTFLMTDEQANRIAQGMIAGTHSMTEAQLEADDTIPPEAKRKIFSRIKILRASKPNQSDRR